MHETDDLSRYVFSGDAFISSCKPALAARSELSNAPAVSYLPERHHQLSLWSVADYAALVVQMSVHVTIPTERRTPHCSGGSGSAACFRSAGTAAASRSYTGTSLPTIMII